MTSFLYHFYQIIIFPFFLHFLSCFYHHSALRRIGKDSQRNDYPYFASMTIQQMILTFHSLEKSFDILKR
jgi:hypothetical protein